jgi:alkanesulfonate monooxygenase SsuD/methylene tetrahydromethanopterin reductase-like flavin-dependent oxidoreductase (luciferase family)
VALAKVLATMDHLSRGRLIVGIGLGGQTHEYTALGLSPERKVRRFEEGVDLLKRLWTEEESLTFDGDFWQMRDASVNPKPLQRPHPPLWFGGSSPAALARAARLGDGFIGAGSTSTNDFASHVDVLRRERSARQGAGDFPIAKRVYIAVDDNRERARSRVREWFGRFYKSPDLGERVAVYGDPEVCIKSLREIGEAGAELVVLHPMFDELEQMETLWRYVIPELPAAG